MYKILSTVSHAALAVFFIGAIIVAGGIDGTMEATKVYGYAVQTVSFGALGMMTGLAANYIGR